MPTNQIVTGGFLIMLKAVITDADFFGGEPKTNPDISRYGARGIALNDKNMAAMILMGANGLYKLPGGGIELGERESDAFVREVLEETGYNCKIIAELGTVEEHKNKSGFSHFSYAFIGRIEGECQKSALSSEKLLDFSTSFMSLQDAAAVMNKSLEMCQDYKMKFMLLRDKKIIDYALEMIDKGEIDIGLKKKKKK